MEKLSSTFVKETMSRFKGDSDEAVAIYNERKSISAIDSQIAQQKAVLVDKEADVQEAEQSYKDAIYPTTKIKDGKAYIENIKQKKESWESKQEELEACKKFIKDLETLKNTSF